MSDASLLAAVAALAEEAARGVGPDDLLRRLVDVVAEHLDGVDGVGVVVADGAALRLVHVSGAGVDEPETVQDVLQSGPCQDAALSGAEVVVDDLTDPAQTAWPEFVDLALGVGLRSVVAVPLANHGRVWGVLDLYRRQPGTWREQELHWARVVAHLAASYLSIATDRDRAQRAQQALEHASTHDALTGLPNRVLLFDRLEHSLSAARRHGRAVAVLFIDLDRFKAVNDTLGHAAGDEVLVAVASRMSAELRDEDTLARLAGDEFVVVCDDLPDPPDGTGVRTHADTLRERLRRALARPLRIGDVDLVVTASIGVAHDDGTCDADALVAEADHAMYLEKHRPPTAARPGTVLPTLEAQLARALPERRLRLHYQPITDEEGTVRTVEALLRWEHPTRGLLPAAEFVDLAESTGLIVDLGHWVVDQACAHLGRWRRAHGAAAPRTVWINLSPAELVDPDLGTVLGAALEENGLEPADVGLEILESGFADSRVLPGLHARHLDGHPLSVDDFGTGYSSLSRLVELPVAMVKVDKSLVAGVAHDLRRRALLDAVVTVAAGLDVQVIAEGIETADQAKAVLAAGCHYLQGFHCGAPEPAETVVRHWAG
ncbi:putative bifunctional diguanylate cyclase/phosphodiesterase [Kineococcus rhizosphaerae]|uniref:Diguanylate cyclase (GGDEF)-like protein n=1 Tax=Kineococcus rhizosphaerae TaxID=559628 RepID=A0A2T0R3Q1_9ACTN|nr:EAL domain-containing protein [Kineococcus rhizosphaerae]PRY14676.1 diguanylate cyclase (GGDEF)-like protein [Kineococcus rhizosphaerae]